LTQQAMVSAVVAPMVFRLAGTVTKPPLVALLDARLTDPVPTCRVVEKVAAIHGGSFARLDAPGGAGAAFRLSFGDATRLQPEPSAG